MIGVLSTVGLTMVFATMIGLFLGLWLDKLLGTAPWMAALFLLIGIFAGFHNLFMHVKKIQQDLDEQSKDEK